MEPQQRLRSLDALRGFDMFFIMGGQMLVASLAVMIPCGLTDGLALQMKHVEWDGFRFYDMIFPLFLFIAGVSFPYSHAKSMASGKTRTQIYMSILRRALVLVLLGLVYNGLLNLDFANLRYPSVLGRIGIAWALAAVVYINFGFKARLALAAGILLFYWGLLALFPAPDMAGAGAFSLEGNLVGYVDRHILPGKLYQGVFDPEGLLSALPAVVTGMLGMFAGDTIRRYGQNGRSVVYLAVTGVVLVVLGLLWGICFPVNKALWSSSFVCLVGGISFLLLALFHYVIDVRGRSGWAFFFVVIGMNSITIYMAQRIINFGYTAGFLGNGVAGLLPESVRPFIHGLFYTAVCWLFLWFLYRRKIFLKV